MHPGGMRTAEIPSRLRISRTAFSDVPSRQAMVATECPCAANSAMRRCFGVKGTSTVQTTRAKINPHRSRDPPKSVVPVGVVASGKRQCVSSRARFPPPLAQGPELLAGLLQATPPTPGSLRPTQGQLDPKRPKVRRILRRADQGTLGFPRNSGYVRFLVGELWQDSQFCRQTSKRPVPRCRRPGVLRLPTSPKGFTSPAFDARRSRCWVISTSTSGSNPWLKASPEFPSAPKGSERSGQRRHSLRQVCNHGSRSRPPATDRALPGNDRPAAIEDCLGPQRVRVQRRLRRHTATVPRGHRR